MLQQNPNKWLKPQKGTALIVSLLIMALVTAMISAASIKQQSNVQRVISIQDADKLYAYTYYVQAWAKVELFNRLKENDIEKQVFKVTMPIYKADNITVEGYIVDMQGLFDVNNLINLHANAKNQETQQKQQSLIPKIFERLLISLPLKQEQINQEQAKAITKNLENWLSAPKEGQKNIYSQQNPPYRAAHIPMSSISELRLILGITPKIYQALAPFVSALPVQGGEKAFTSININTALEPILAALLGLDDSEVKTLIAKRPFKDATEFKQAVENNKIPPEDWEQISGLIDIKSQYFLVVSTAKSSNREAVLYTLLNRKSNGIIDVIWQSRGGA